MLRDVGEYPRIRIMRRKGMLVGNGWGSADVVMMRATSVLYCY